MKQKLFQIRTKSPEL